MHIAYHLPYGKLDDYQLVDLVFHENERVMLFLNSD